MKIENILLYVSLLCFISGYSQSTAPYELQLFFTGVKNHKIDFQKSEMSTVMIFSKDTSTAVLSDKHLEKARKMIEESKDGGKKVIKILEGYKRYKTDSVTIERSGHMEQNVDNFIKNWAKIESKMMSNPDQRLILDGHSVRLELKKDNKIYNTLYVRSPSSDSHPEIFEIISKMESYYKTESSDPLIE